MEECPQSSVRGSRSPPGFNTSDTLQKHFHCETESRALTHAGLVLQNHKTLSQLCWADITLSRPSTSNTRAAPIKKKTPQKKILMLFSNEDVRAACDPAVTRPFAGV